MSKRKAYQMKTTILLLVTLLGLTACAPASGPSAASTVAPIPDSGNAGGTPDPSLPEIVATPTPSPTATPQPTATPAPLVATPTPAPSPTPSPTPAPPVHLACYSNNGVFCTGGNLTSNLVELDIDLLFTGNNAQEQVVIDSVVNDVIATAHTTCAQPNGAGCFQHSVCVHATIEVPSAHSSFPYVWCGNSVKTQNNTLEDL